MKTASIFASLLLAGVISGCHSDSQPAANTTANESPAAKSGPKQGPGEPPECGLSDPSSVESCRFWREVQAKKKLSNSNNVVKHSPGSIAQP